MQSSCIVYVHMHMLRICIPALACPKQHGNANVFSSAFGVKCGCCCEKADKPDSISSFLFIFQMAVVLCFYSFILTFGSIPCESSDWGGKKICHSSLFSFSISCLQVGCFCYLWVSEGCFGLCTTNIVGQSIKNLFYKSFTNLGSTDILQFWI